MSEDKADRPRVASSLADYLDDELTGLPDVLDVHQAAEQIAALFVANEGATFNLYFGNMLDQPYYAVSIYLDREAKHSVFWSGRNLSLVKLRSLMASSHQLLRGPRNSVGLWYDEEDGNTYLEITATLPHRDEADREEAVNLGGRYNQIGMYDLQAREYVPLGGTGTLPKDAPPVSERLPKLERGREHG